MFDENGNKRKVVYIDVGEMSEKEMCKLLNIEYIPWYKNFLFWAIVLFCLNIFLISVASFTWIK